MESRLKLIRIITVVVLIVVRTGEATNDYAIESDPNFDDAATKYLTAIDSQLDVLDRNESSKMVFSECNFQKEDFKKIITSVTKAMDFFTLRLHNVVLDAAIGTRLLQSQLKVVKDGHPKLPPALQMYLTNLQLQSELLSELIIESVSDSTKFTKQSKQEQLPWVLNSSLWEQPKVGGWKSLEILETEQQLLNSSSPFKEFDRTVEVLSEEISDRCTAELFDDCKVTENCTKVFAEKPHSAYSLTHQVLFFLIAEKQNCFKNENFKSKIQGNSPNKFFDKLCKEVLLEGNFIEHSGYQPNYRDLLSEQITVCAVAGYPNFLKRKWLEEILSWQNKDALGCFSLEAGDDVAGVAEDEAEEVEEEDDDPLENEDEEDEILRDAAGLVLTQQNGENRRNKIAKMNLRRRLSSTSKRNRVKRADEIVKIGKKNCSIHFTAVSLGSLSMYLRYFVDTCLNQY